MVQETEKKAEQELKPLMIPVAVIQRQGKILAIREEPAQKYIRNEWCFLIGRPWRGEEEVQDLVGLAKECGLGVVAKKEIGKVNGSHLDAFSARRPVVFNFVLCQAVEGDFNPAKLLPERVASHYNRLSNYSGHWFEVDELNRQPEVHHLVREALEFLKRND